VDGKPPKSQNPSGIGKMIFILFLTNTETGIFSIFWDTMPDPKGFLVYPGVLLAGMSGLLRHFAGMGNL
jgi:hypothetical protein